MLPVGSVTPMKMKTFKSKYPLKSELSIATIEKFINQQNQIIELINQAREVNLTKTKCNLTINITSLRLGDALRFYVFHNVRHIVQANRIIGKTNDF